MSLDNTDLQKIYDDAYEKGSSAFFSETDGDEWPSIISLYDAWKGKTVLEIGSGEGELSLMIKNKGAKSVWGVDYSQVAVDTAKKNVMKNTTGISFTCQDWKEIKEKFDVIVMAGVLEHFDEPFSDLEYMLNEMLNDKGVILTSSPSFINPRGYVWMTLALLFDVPMSLTDLHFFGPWDFEQFAETHSLKMEMKSCDFEWGGGKYLIKDYKKRLPNALRDAKLNNENCEKLIEWLSKSLSYYQKGAFEGATMVYKLQK